MSSRGTRPNDARRKRLMAFWMDEAANAPGNYLGYAPCEIAWDRGCQGRAFDGHEILPRSHGGSIHDRKNVLLTCRYCHDKAHANPDEAYRRGVLRGAPPGA